MLSNLGFRMYAQSFSVHARPLGTHTQLPKANSLREADSHLHLKHTLKNIRSIFNQRFLRISHFTVNNALIIESVLSLSVDTIQRGFSMLSSVQIN